VFVWTGWKYRDKGVRLVKKLLFFLLCLPVCAHGDLKSNFFQDGMLRDDEWGGIAKVCREFFEDDTVRELFFTEPASRGLVSFTIDKTRKVETFPGSSRSHNNHVKVMGFFVCHRA